MKPYIYLVVAAIDDPVNSEDAYQATSKRGSLTHNACMMSYVTGYEKRDHLGFFIKNEFLAWIDSSMCAAYNGASSKKKY